MISEDRNGPGDERDDETVAGASVAGSGVPTQPPDQADAGAQDAADPDIDPDLVNRIIARARTIARERLRGALSQQARTSDELSADLLDQVADEESERADGALLRVSIAEATALELGIDSGEALRHGAAERALELLGVPRRSSSPVREPVLLLDAVHIFGIEGVRERDRDIELRLANTGIDVRRPSTGEAIGRLSWDDIETVVVQRPRRGPPGLRRSSQLIAGTEQGEVTFELVGLSDTDITDHLEPLIARNCEGFRGAAAG